MVISRGWIAGGGASIARPPTRVAGPWGRGPASGAYRTAIGGTVQVATTGGLPYSLAANHSPGVMAPARRTNSSSHDTSGEPRARAVAA